MTEIDLPTAPYLAACRAYGAAMEKLDQFGPEEIKSHAWQACIEALRAYEAERRKEPR